MCHLVLLLPLITVPLFWLAPLSMALPVNVAILPVALVIYWYAMRAMRLPNHCGPEGMIGEVGKVVVGDLRKVRARFRNELWTIACNADLNTGDFVKVVGTQGTVLKVERTDVSGVGV